MQTWVRQYELLRRTYFTLIIQYIQIHSSVRITSFISNTYFNQVVLLETSLASPSLLEVLLDIEKALGRVRNEAGYTDRTMDLDILDYEGKVSTSEQLILPHPRLHLRLFTLLPMAEVAPHWVHPSSDESIDTLLAKCPDRVQPNRLSR